MNSPYFKLYRAYSNSFNSSNVGNFFFWSWILNNCNKVQKKKKQVVVLCSRPGQNVKLKCTKKRDALAKLLFCQSKPIGCLPFSLPSSSSLLKPLNITDQGSVSGKAREPLGPERKFWNKNLLNSRKVPTAQTIIETLILKQARQT